MIYTSLAAQQVPEAGARRSVNSRRKFRYKQYLDSITNNS